MRKILCAAVLGALSLTHVASAQERPLRFVVTGGLTFGGDTLITTNYTNGRSYDTKAGGLVQMGGGVLWQPSKLPLALQATINFHSDGTIARNGDSSFTRFPLELIGFYLPHQDWRIGAGVRYVMSPEAEAHQDGYADTKLEYKDTTGFVVEAGYQAFSNGWVSLRYVSEEYELESARYGNSSFNVSNVRKADGSHVGVFFSYNF